MDPEQFAELDDETKAQLTELEQKIKEHFPNEIFTYENILEADIIWTPYLT